MVLRLFHRSCNQVVVLGPDDFDIDEGPLGYQGRVAIGEVDNRVDFRGLAGEGRVTNQSGLVPSIRNADFIMLHTIDSQAFARAAMLVEN